MKKKKKLYEGQSKKMYTLSDSDQLIQEFKDDVPGNEGANSQTIKGKGSVNKDISAFLFEYLGGFNIPTHFIKNLGGREMLVKQLEMIPIEVVMTNIAADQMSQRYGLEEGTELHCPILEFYLRTEDYNNPMINQSHIVAFELATNDEVRMIERMTSKINAVLKSYFLRRDFKLVDFKIEFGRHKNKLVLGDEISLDTFRLLDILNEGENDSETFRVIQRASDTDYEKLKERILQ